MLKRYPLIFRFVIFIVFPVCIGVAYLYFHFKSSVTVLNGDLLVNGLEDSVEIQHDSYGTPRIVATTDHDAYFALGFKHASDRLWQLEVQRRLYQGRLSEIFGSKTITQDIAIRNLGLRDASNLSVSYLKQDTLSALNAYAAGINAWVSQATSLPIEFQLYGVHPETWTVVDSIGCQKIFSMMLSGNMKDELLRVQLQDYLTQDQMRYFYPYDPVFSMTLSEKMGSNDSIRDDGLIEFGIGYRFVGSNAWVVAGKYTESGHPIIANDSHMGLQLPSLWYAASIKGDKLNASGMTLVGIPAVIYGQNTAIAWAGTNLVSDQQDLFIETISPQKPNQYLSGGEWKKFETRKELIRVSADFPAVLREKLNPLEIEVRKTERGPIISDVIRGFDAVISLRWAGLDADDRTMDTFIDVQYAQNWIEFRNSLSLLKSPGINYLYADRAGNIGYQVAGMLPKRLEGVGVLPLVSSKQNDWQGYYDFDLLPSEYNPSTGLIVSANEEVESSGVVISHEWAPKARHDRITSLIKQRIDSGKSITLSDMKIIQKDRLDLTAKKLLSVFVKVQAETSQEKQAQKLLKSWSGEFNSNSVGATLFVVWSHYLKHEIFDGVLRQDDSVLGNQLDLSSAFERLSWSELARIASSDGHQLCEPNQSVNCMQELHRSFKRALNQLEKISGTEAVEKWQWSKFSGVRYALLGDGKERIYKKYEHSLASPNSINSANIMFDPLNGIWHSFGSTFRQIIELDEQSSHWYMNSTGESGNIMSTHYDDMIEPFLSNKMKIMAPENNDSGSVLNLIPSRKGLK